MKVNLTEVLTKLTRPKTDKELFSELIGEYLYDREFNKGNNLERIRHKIMFEAVKEDNTIYEKVFNLIEEIRFLEEKVESIKSKKTNV